MKVILLESIPSLGAAGAVVDVAKGYARNFLIPQKKALQATAGNIAQVEQTKTRVLQQADQARETAQMWAAQLSGLTLTIPQRVGEADRLYGSVTAAMVAEALVAKGFEVDKKQLELAEPIKKLGTYEITVRLAPEATAQIQVEVVPETD
jgi:large subunit ribosomal protein L9